MLKSSMQEEPGFTHLSPRAETIYHQEHEQKFGPEIQQSQFIK